MAPMPSPSALMPTLALCCGCAGALPTPTTEAELRTRARQALDALVDDSDVPGIGYSVVTHDRVLFEGYAGVMDASRRAKVTRDTAFMAYSTTKALTALVVLQLVERGVLSLDAPLSTYFDAHPYGGALTLRMLLAHTAGVPNPMPLDWFFVEGERMDRDAALRRVLAGSDELADPPGAVHRYSNLGYWLIERAVEAATGRPYAEVVSEQVFTPLGIRNGAGFELPPPGQLATGHSRKWTFETPVFYLLTPSRYWAEPADGWSRFERLASHGLAYGGLYTTVPAFAAVCADLLRPESKLLGSSAKATLFAPQHTKDGEPTGEALGWVLGELETARYVGKQGGGIGFHGNVRIYPELGIGSVVFANATRVSPGPIDELSDGLDAPFVQMRGTTGG